MRRCRRDSDHVDRRVEVDLVEVLVDDDDLDVGRGEPASRGSVTIGNSRRRPFSRRAPAVYLDGSTSVTRMWRNPGRKATARNRSGGLHRDPNHSP